MSSHRPVRPPRPVIRPATPPYARRGKFARLLAEYDYDLPRELIALRPAVSRDSAKLLVYDRTTHEIATTVFSKLGDWLPRDSVLVLNDTKVIPARITFSKPTGGQVTLLYLSHNRATVTMLADRRLERGWMLTGPGKKMLRVIRHQGSEYVMQPVGTVGQFLRWLDHHGTTPLPPYLRRSPLSEAKRREMYQTVFSKKSGSVAAPTASLHFTKRLLQSLKKQGVAIEYVTLHVSLGTFAPVTDQHLKTNQLHREEYEITEAAAARMNRYKAQGRPIIAVGTTTARTLESATRRGRLVPGRSSTELFIQPGYRWKFVDGLITNYHVPRSSLLMLVAALVGRDRLFALYRYAITKKFGFFSFGDGMLVR